MQSQRTPSIDRWSQSHARDGLVVAGGYGLRICIGRGQLEVEDGIGQDRRARRFHRATSGLKRLVVLGHTGYVSLEALRWLADIKSGYLQIDADGRVLAAFGPPGTDRPSLRRAQAMATETDQALALSRWLVDAKLAAQIETLHRFADRVATAEAIGIVDAYRLAAAEARSPDELRSCEAWAAGAYWQALAPLPVRFARRDAERVPSHWHSFGGRSSPIANGPRMAANPANAVLNYLYALLEAEATLAARIVGLDPGLGVMHVDQAYRDSLACDLMEPVRPLVDAYAFELLGSRSFAAREFHETRTGVCRVTAPLSHELAESMPQWGQLVGQVAEDLVNRLESPGQRPATPVPTPITQRRRAAGRPGGARAARPPASSISTSCSWCGGPTKGRRRTCSEECREAVNGGTLATMAQRASERMTRLAGKPGHPALTAQANEKRRETRRQQRHAELEWERTHPGSHDRDRFGRDVLPILRGRSATALANLTGLSISYCAAILAGQRIPHPRWWDALQEAEARVVPGFDVSP